MHTSNGPLPPLISSQRKIPDLCTYDRKDKTRVLLQIEVDSGDLNKTLRKVALVRIDQLLYERNLDDSISICIVFYFPNNSSSTSVMKVTLMWSDETTNSIVPEENVIREIKTAIQLKKNKAINMQQTREKVFVLPQSKSFMERTFREGSVQCLSKHSIVIVNSNGGRKVYKKII